MSVTLKRQFLVLVFLLKCITKVVLIKISLIAFNEYVYVY